MFKEGLYEFKYETNSGVQHYIGVVNNIDLHSIMTTIHMFEGNDTQDLVKKWRLSEGDMYKYINTFDNIHEVSKCIKEIEEKEEIKVWDWVIIPDESGEYNRSDVGSVVGWNYEKDEVVVKWLYGERVVIGASHLQKITELEAICLLTGNRNYELVDDDHDVVLRADWDGQEEQIKQLREENKQLRKDKESLNKEVDTWANKARLSDRKCEEIESQLRALENDKNNRDKAVTIIDQVETIHKIVLQLRKKYLS